MQHSPLLRVYRSGARACRCRRSRRRPIRRPTCSSWSSAPPPTISWGSRRCARRARDRGLGKPRGPRSPPPARRRGRHRRRPDAGQERLRAGRADARRRAHQRRADHRPERAAPESGAGLSGLEAGGIDFLVKPVDPHLLRSKVGVFIELSRQRLLLSAQVEQLHALQRTSELLMGVLGHDLRNPLNAISLAARPSCSRAPTTRWWSSSPGASVQRRSAWAGWSPRASTSRRCARGRGRSRPETPTWASSAGPRRVSSRSWTSAASTAACRAIRGGAGSPTAFSSSSRT